MSDKRDAFEELVAADPVDRDRLESPESPVAQHLLTSILETPREPARTPRTPIARRSPMSRSAAARHRRRLAPALALMLVTLVAGTTAFAIGLFPREGQHLLEQTGCRDASSIEELVAQADTAEGHTFQFWITRASADAPANGHILVEVDADGDYRGGAIGCGRPGEWDETELGDTWAVGPTAAGPTGTLTAIMGHAHPAAVAVQVTLSDGTSTWIDVQTGGYFLGLVRGPGVATGPGTGPPDLPDLVHISAVDADGVVIAERDLP